MEENITDLDTPPPQLWDILPPLHADVIVKQQLRAVPHDRGAEDGFFSSQPPRVVYRQDTQPRQVIFALESFRLYEAMLRQVRRISPNRFKSMHKGTPYFLMGWLAFAMKDYERAVFYMDSALSEDLANHASWQNTPASSFLMISRDYGNSVAPEIAQELRKEVDGMMRRFNNKSPVHLTTYQLTSRFIGPNITDSAYRSIMTSFNTFALERKERLMQLRLRSARGGSTEPFITHLFKGALIFESVLKRKFNGETLGDCLTNAVGQLNINRAVYRGYPHIKLTDVPVMMSQLASQPIQERVVAITYAIRNTTGHDLGWADMFSYNTYRQLADAVADSILWAIATLY